MRKILKNSIFPLAKANKGLNCFTNKKTLHSLIHGHMSDFDLWLLDTANKPGWIVSISPSRG